MHDFWLGGGVHDYFFEEGECVQTDVSLNGDGGTSSMRSDSYKHSVILRS